MNTEVNQGVYDYTIRVHGGKEHGRFEIEPPLLAPHMAQLRQAQMTKHFAYGWAEEGNKHIYSLEAEDNHRSGFGEYYRSVLRKARQVQFVLSLSGIKTNVIPDQQFEERSINRLREIQQANARDRI